MRPWDDHSTCLAAASNRSTTTPCLKQGLLEVQGVRAVEVRTKWKQTDENSRSKTLSSIYFLNNIILIMCNIYHKLGFILMLWAGGLKWKDYKITPHSYSVISHQLPPNCSKKSCHNKSWYTCHRNRCCKECHRKRWHMVEGNTWW